MTSATPSNTSQSPLWHPFADPRSASSREVLLVAGSGATVVDNVGRSYLDASAGLWCCNVGHGRRELVDAAERQMRALAGYQIFDVFANSPAIELANRLAEIAPTGRDSAIFFTVGGSDGIDTAVKMARRYWSASGQPERVVIVAREGAYHGMHGIGTSLSGIEANGAGWGQLIPDIVHVPRNDLGAIEATFENYGGRVAAFVGEPVQGAAGVYPPPEGYWSGVRALCDEHDVLLIADEVICGFGRLGTWFGSDRYDIEPDLAVAAKGVSSGYLPIGAVFAGARVRDRIWDAGWFRHGYTYSGHPTCCAVALANLDVLVRERLFDRVVELEPQLRREVEQLSKHALVAEVRCAGLLAGVELVDLKDAGSSALAARVVEIARDAGVLVRSLLGRTLQISPPFVVTAEQLTQIRETLSYALDRAIAE